MIAKIEKFFQHLTLSQELTSAAFVLIIALLGGASGYGYFRIATLTAEVDRLNAEFASTTALLQNNIADATTSLGNALQQEKDRLGDVQDQVGSIGGTVTDLQKLSKIDPELLAKYSKVFFLSENYKPLELTEIATKYLYNDQRKLQVITQVYPYLKRMLERAEDDEVKLYVQSAYRSFFEQQALKGQYTFTYGAGTANQFSADQGYSEHQLGTTVDFITTGLNGQLSGFENTPAYAWLQKNAHRYGFVLSYPKNNGYYIFEPWHWRFVGDKLATDLHESGDYFYNLDQRAIDTYLISLFD